MTSLQVIAGGAFIAAALMGVFREGIRWTPRAYVLLGVLIGLAIAGILT